MGTNNKKSLSAQALLDMDSVVSAIKEESKKTISGLLTEAVKGALRESVEDDDEKDYEVVDDEKDGAEDKKKKDSKKSSSKDVSEQGEDELEGMPQGGADAQAQMQQPQAADGQEQMPQGQDAEMTAGQEQEAPEVGMGDEQGAAPQEGGDEEGWDDFSQYQVGDETYDLTGEKDPNKLKGIYKLLSDEDNIVVTKDGDMLHFADNNAGTEYVIDLGEIEGEGEDAEAEAPEEDMSMDGGEDEMPANLNEDNEFDVAGFPDEEDDDLGDDFDSDSIDGVEDEPIEGDGDEHSDEFDEFDEFGNEDEDDDDFVFEGDDIDFGSDDLGGGENNLEENRKRKPMKESKEVLFEVDLGYTDNYQDKDPIKGLSNNEPSKSGKSWHKGVPTGTQKPWAGPSKPKGDPFGKTVDEEEEKCCPKCGKCGDECTCGKEVEEQKNVGGFVQQNSVTASNIPNSNGRKARSQRSASQGVEVTGSADPRYKGVNESKELKAIKKENRELKKAVIELRKNLNEAYITNVNLGKITKLFLENTTSKSEKVDIVNRFANEANTVEKSKALYESISRELKKNNKAISLNETSQTANGTKALNENTYKSQDVLKTIDFMNRVLNC